MPKTLSVIIPYYKESQADIFPLLSSIRNQVGIDFDRVECILVNDGANNKLPPEFLAQFNMDIRCIFMDENKGPGVARQTGLDNANGEYVMFCDADDTLHSVAVLGAFLNEIDEFHPDIIESPWIEEMFNEETGRYVYINHENEATWMHGKLFLRRFLQAKNIRFHDDLRVHEDSYFLALAYAATDNRRKCPFTSYVWKFVPTSITRRNGAAYTFESMPEFFKALDLAFAQLVKTAPQEMPFKAIQFVMYNYFVLHRKEWNTPENKEVLHKTESEFASMIAKYMHYFKKSDAEFVSAIYNQERAKHFSNGIETETIGEWLKRISLKNPA